MASSLKFKRHSPSSGRNSCEKEDARKDHAECYPAADADRPLEVSPIKTVQIVKSEKVSEAVSIMEEILKPSHANSDVKGRVVKELHRHSVFDSGESLASDLQHTPMQEIRNGHKDAEPAKDETLPLADQLANEEKRTKVQSFPWASSYGGVEELVREYEIETTSAFLRGNPDRDFGKAFGEIKYAHNVHLDGGGFGNDLSPRLCLDGTPYLMMGNRRLTCHHGKPQYQSAKKVKGKQRLCIQASKKVGCPSHIVIRHVMLLPDFIFDKHKITEHRRRELSKYIKAVLKEKHAITTESRYYIEFPDVSSHKNHALGEAAGVKQPIDKRVNEKMLQLISDGMKSVPQIERTIKDFVRDELFKGSACPPNSNRRFFPTQKDINNRIFKVAVNAHSSKLKRRDLEELVSSWLEQQRAEGGFVFFRNVPGSCSGNHDGTRADASPVSSKEGLLFIYQTRHQRRLLARYGCDLTFLEPAHRQAAYAIPLFFLLVHTNCDYHIAAVIAMERESVKGLQEALGHLKGANPSWSPQQFMVDAAEVEIQTVESLFPDCRVFITDFRRQQAWEQYLDNPKHSTSAGRQKLLAKMTGIVTARTPESYQAAMNALRRAWTKPALKQIRAWFREKWIANVQRWAYIYRQHRQMLPLIVNNGVEAQREALVYPYITSNRRSTLHSLLDHLIRTVLPNMQAGYIRANETWSMATDSGVSSPVFYNRPQPFVDHCQQRIMLARRIEKASVTQTAWNAFRFNDAGGEDLVDLNVPSCTCRDFTGTGLPCVHLLACIADGDDLLWEQLPSSYLYSPFLTVDKGGAVDGPAGVASGGDQSHGADEDDEVTVAVPGLSAEEEATSSLEAILAAVEAQTVTESTNPSMNPASTADDSPPDEAVRCQATARELLDLTHVVTDTEVLARARIQMEAIVASLSQALPREELLHHPVCHRQPAAGVQPVGVTRDLAEDLDQELRPAKRQRLEEEETVEIGVVDGDDRETLEVGESIVTETIDLQQGAVFILEPSGVMRNVQIVDTSSADSTVEHVIIKDT